MRIKYFDFESKPIDENSTSQMGDCYKAYLDNDNQFRFIETIEENEVVSIDYYLGDNEVIDEVLEKYKHLKQLNFFTKKHISGEFSRYEVITSFENVKQNVIRLQVFKDLLLAIYDLAADTTTNQKVYFSKNHYDLENRLHYEFEYESNGEFKKITVYDPTNYVDTSDFTILPHQVGKHNNAYGFDWEGFEYYQNASPIFPE